MGKNRNGENYNRNGSINGKGKNHTGGHNGHHTGGTNGKHECSRYCVISADQKLFQTDEGENRFSFFTAKKMASAISDLLKINVYVVPEKKVTTLKLDVLLINNGDDSFI